MKFKDMPYERYDCEKVKKDLAEITEAFNNAKSYEEAKALFLKVEEESRHLDTAVTLAQVRHSIDTRIKFYEDECLYYNQALPEVEEYSQAWNLAMLKSPFRKDFEKEFGDLMFINTEIELKTFSPEIVPMLQKENDITQEYEKLLASAKIDFRGKTYTLSQLSPFMSDPDDATRKEACIAAGSWFKANQPAFDEYYDKLVHLRDEMGKTLGYEGYTTLGYYRMGRNCYTKEDVEKFRAAVVKYLVPVAAKIYKKQAERIGKPYPLSYQDMALEFRSGNPKPAGDPDELLQAGKRFYDELSPETSEFFRIMLDDELMDVLSTEGKQSGGYCTGILDYGVPFIFANFNGTKHDVEVITHEAGHAFAAYMNRDRIPMSYMWPSMEACEVHSMSMEFFGETHADDFFGKDARKFLYSHLADSLTFIPYGTMVDHFQHEVYANPDWTPRQRHDCWKQLIGVYMPWLRLDGEIPFFSDGEHWQRQHHIYSSPFYYIDYCFAQTVSLEFWAMIQKDRKMAWDYYMAYTRQGGSRTFTDLLKNAGLGSPFDEETLRGVCAQADEFLANFDLTGIE